MAVDLARALSLAVAAAREAGEVLRADLHRPGGPRGGGDKAEADTEAEHVIRDRLAAAFTDWAYLGEETGSAPGKPGAPLWLVDPNDGTRDYLKGRRGSAVSIGLLVDRVPRLGVVYAFAYPDDAGDLFAWAEGCGPLERDGRPLEVDLPSVLGSSDVVLVSSAGDDDAEGNLACAAPARFRTVPSIAHRLALVAAGEGAAGVSLNWPGAWDYGAGHALLRGVGAALVDERGRSVDYGADGRSSCRHAFGGRLEAARALASRDWRPGGRRRRLPEGFPVRLERGRALADSGRLARAQGCLLGQVAGDNLGALVEFESAARIAAAHADGPRRLVDGGRWNIDAGQPTDDSEMALALARSIVAEGRYVSAAARRAYEAWLRSAPFDVGGTVRGALVGSPDPQSEANGALMRASPIGVLAHAMTPDEAADLARQDASLTHVNPACGDASAAFVVALAHAVREGDGPQAAWDAARRWAEEAQAAPLVREALAAARHEPPVCDGPSQGWVVATVRRGGDSDTNAAVAGALLGAVHGRAALPAQWRSMVQSCRPLAPRARVPRPRECWPIDVLELAERLTLAGERQAR
jgi:ADP-ribosylglycohydrolase/fructose-1,6-bisphosphatase/inositol monophosphatase family enzyme